MSFGVAGFAENEDSGFGFLLLIPFHLAVMVFPAVKLGDVTIDFVSETSETQEQIGENEKRNLPAKCFRGMNGQKLFHRDGSFPAVLCDCTS